MEDIFFNQFGNFPTLDVNDNGGGLNLKPPSHNESEKESSVISVSSLFNAAIESASKTEDGLKALKSSTYKWLKLVGIPDS